MKHSIVITGGSGFVGSHLARRLLQDGHHVRILSRHAGKAIRYPLPEQVELVACDVHEPEQLKAAFNGCDVAINLVGILNERGHDGRGFHQAHVALTHKVIDACQSNGITRLLHMSALWADAIRGTSYYLRSKGEAEDAVHASGLQVTSFRPSVIFGEGDSFLNRFAKLLAIPGPFPLACAEARFAPIWVEDVAECFASAVDNEETCDGHYDLCGPKEYTLEELVRYVAQLQGRRKWIVPLGESLSTIQANLLEYVPGKPFSRDNLNSTKTPSVCACGFPEVFDLRPHELEDIAPDYIS